MEGGVALDVDGIWIERDFSLAMLEQVGYSFEVVVLSSHEEDVLVALVGDFHVGSVSLEEVDHIDIAMQSCKM